MVLAPYYRKYDLPWEGDPDSTRRFRRLLTLGLVLIGPIARLTRDQAMFYFLSGYTAKVAGTEAGVTDPEQKRKTIGRLFIDVFDAEAKKIGGAEFLAQGTLYPDVIESVSFTGGPSVTIKSHHNVGGLPARMNMKLVEPLRELFKDEVRALGRELGLPQAFVGRHAELTALAELLTSNRLVTITGTATQGQTLTASNTLADADGFQHTSPTCFKSGIDFAGTLQLTQIFGVR